MAKVSKRTTKSTPAKSTPAKAAPAKAATPSGAARPGNQDAAGKGNKKTKVDYPGLFNDDGEEQRLAYLPDVDGEKTFQRGEDEFTVDCVKWDNEIHKPLLRKHFINEVLYFNWRATTLRWQADEYEAKAKEASKKGSKSDQAKLRRLQKMKEQMAKLEASLAEAGIDIDELDDDDDE